MLARQDRHSRQDGQRFRDTHNLTKQPNLP
jgi:hypothetical protein